MNYKKKKFIENLFIVCDNCGYNNFKNRFQEYGTCLRCGKVLDKKVYFKAQMKKKLHLKINLRDKG